jgi:2Fe-2S ferredoxin
MPKVNFQTSAGETVVVDANQGLTLMEVAVDNNVSEILAECGGACACATCHVYVADEWQSKLPAIDDMEDAMLESAADRQPGSRLSCQIEVTSELDGLTVKVACNDS